MISTKVLLYKSTLKVEVDLLMYQSGAEYLMEVVCVEENIICSVLYYTSILCGKRNIDTYITVHNI